MVVLVSDTEVVYKKKVETCPGDRPDYSGMVSKVVVSSIGLGQEGYWATSTLSLNAGEGVWFTIDKGFSIDYEYIPENKRFFLDEFTVTASDNVLIKIGVGVQKKGETNVRAIGWGFGYGEASLKPKRAYAFLQDTRPVYYIKNEGSNPITVTINIYGVLEPLI